MKIQTRIVALLVIFTICITGCNKKPKDTSEYLIFEVENPNELLYDNIACTYKAESGSNRMDIYRPKDRYINYYSNALAIKLMLYEDDVDKLYHVIVDPIIKEGVAEHVANINEEKGLQLKVEDWYKFEYGFPAPCTFYYYVFTAEEIAALTDACFICRYVGSGEGTPENIDLSTPEGLDAYCELYGDDHVQYIKGREIHVWWEQ